MLKTKQATATNADKLSIMRNPEDQKTTATIADLLLLSETLTTKKQRQRRRFTFNYAKS